MLSFRWVNVPIEGWMGFMEKKIKSNVDLEIRKVDKKGGKMNLELSKERRR